MWKIIFLFLLCAQVTWAHGMPPDPEEEGPEKCTAKAIHYKLFCETNVMRFNKYMVCDSTSSEEKECPLNVPEFHKIVALTVDKVHSEAPCVEDQTFGSRDDVLWVKDGCVATFAVQVGPDMERCAAMKNELELNDCQSALQDTQTCSADIKTLCPELGKHRPPPHHRPWRQGAQGFPGDHHHGPQDFPSFAPHGDGDFNHGPRGPPHRFGPHDERFEHEGPPRFGEGPHHHHCMMGHAHEWMPRDWLHPEARLDGLSFELSQCMRDHMDSLSQECQETAMVALLTNPGIDPMIIHMVVFLAFIASGGLLFMMGLAYFFWQRKRLQERRSVKGAQLGKWSTGLFLWDWRTFFPSCCFPMFQSALNQAEVHDRDSSIADLAMNACHQGMLANTYNTRQAIRAKYDIPAEPVADCLASAFCLPCALAQNARELEARHSDSALLSPDAYIAEGVPAKEVDAVVMI